MTNQATQTEPESPLYYVSKERHVEGEHTAPPVFDSVPTIVEPRTPTTSISIEDDELNPNPPLRLTKLGAAVLGFVAGATVATIITSYVMYVQINGL